MKWVPNLKLLLSSLLLTFRGNYITYAILGLKLELYFKQSVRNAHCWNNDYETQK